MHAQLHILVDTHKLVKIKVSIHKKQKYYVFDNCKFVLKEFTFFPACIILFPNTLSFRLQIKI